ncbi:hypothetical protein LF599_07610 [Pseudodesulfovibrio thermohalotolerans]|uniref:hypothetical protein n=1 Tax=Pseudodesulfovibrio thermohalotolerans TaxID=2880651 RepID=UPI0022BA1085|nr:hypothetical protein [Pseudodesulfovibrio thermohalotolerans]WFS64021.1 hypothetical protein LF599_07610 [Pseudodesulfovibrio thermohalotolerans]
MIKKITTIACGVLAFGCCAIGAFSLVNGGLYMGSVLVMFGIMFAAMPVIHEQR